MKNWILIYFALALLPLSGATQTDESIAMRTTETSLHSFVEPATELVGYKRGDVIVFEPQFDSLWSPDHIEHITIVRRQKENAGEFVYLTSQGQIIDSVRPYFFDNGPDAEHNGFIRFRDNHSEHVGLLNRRGEVVVPAKYNELSHVRNGFLTALIDADIAREGEHTYFVGGEEILLDTLGEFLSIVLRLRTVS